MGDEKWGNVGVEEEMEEMRRSGKEKGGKGVTNDNIIINHHHHQQPLFPPPPKGGGGGGAAQESRVHIGVKCPPYAFFSPLKHLERAPPGFAVQVGRRGMHRRKFKIMREEKKIMEEDRNGVRRAVYGDSP